MTSNGRDLSPRRYDVAATLVHRASHYIETDCLRQDGSLLTPGQPIWTLAHAEELHTHFVQAPDESKRAFRVKLHDQLSHCSPGAIQLAAELLYVNVLPLADQKPETKKELIVTVLGWSDHGIALPEHVLGALENGQLFSGGVAFKTLRWAQFAMLVSFVREWKTLPPQQRTDALADPWRFRTIVMGVSADKALAQRLSLLHLVFPSVFEPIVSKRHRRMITTTYGDRAGVLSGDTDRDLALVRTALEKEHGGPVDFYEEPWLGQWNPSRETAPGPEEAATPAARAWLVRGASVRGADLVPQWLGHGFCSLDVDRLGEINPEVTPAEVKALIEAAYDHLSYSARTDLLSDIQAFLGRMQADDLVATTASGKVYLGRLTGAARWTGSEDGRSDLRRPVQWLVRENPLDYENLPDPLPARLSSQRTVVDLTTELDLLNSLIPTEAEDSPEPGRAGAETRHTAAGIVRSPALRLRAATPALARDLLIAQDWLQESIDLLQDRRQIIFYGPPGTGKTYLAQHIAWHLTERQNVKLVQFHPAYSYEDFFEGFRPAAGSDGHSIAFDRRPGPLRRLVTAAERTPDQPHVLIIDEINRANLANVFGELYFLLEYRDHAVELMYADPGEKEFTLPKNIYLIGTMNTADRSIALVDAAMRRRFAFLELHPAQPPISGLLGRWLKRQRERAEQTADSAHDAPQTSASAYGDEPALLLDVLNARITDRDFKIGPSYLMRPEVYRDGGLARTWRTSILPLLEEHHYGEDIEVAKRYGLQTLRGSLPPAGDTDGFAPIAPTARPNTIDRTTAPGEPAVFGDS